MNRMSNFNQDDKNHGQKLFHLLATDAAFVARKTLLSPRSNSLMSLQKISRRPRTNPISSSFSYPCIQATAASIERSEFENAIAIAAAIFSFAASKNSQKPKAAATSTTIETSVSATIYTAESSIVSKRIKSLAKIPKVKTAAAAEIIITRKPKQHKTATNKTATFKETKQKKSNFTSLGGGLFLQELVMVSKSIRKMGKPSKVSLKSSMFRPSRISNKK